jgi:poly(A) polymerase
MLERVSLAARVMLTGLVEAGYEAYFVGGCVRDLLLGLEPKDFDITTSATPQQVALALQYKGADVDLVGAHFGVSLAKFLGETIEVATFRTDGAYSDGRRPDDVKYTTDVREDVKRRDFTINALLLDIHGAVLDHVGGMGDLVSGVVRAVGDPYARIEEDPVRMLRAVKFASRLSYYKVSFHLDPLLSLAIQHCGRLLRRVAPERIASELASMLTSGHASLAIRMLEKHHLLRFINPALEELRSTPQNPKYHPEGDVMTHTLKLLGQLPKGCSLTLALGALLHDIGKPITFGRDEEGQPTFHGHEERGAIMTMAVLRDLKFSNDVIETVTSLVANHMRFRVLADMRRSKQLRFVRQPNFEELLELHRIDALAGSGNLANYEYAKQLLTDTPPEVIRPVRLVTGDDLIASGLKPGPHFKDLLARIEDAQLEGTINTRADALEMVTEYIGG